jgi:hypothetical protein
LIGGIFQGFPPLGRVLGWQHCSPSACSIRWRPCVSCSCCRSRSSETSRNPAELTLTAELRVVGSSSADVSSGSDHHSFVSSRGEALAASTAGTSAQWQATQMTQPGYLIGLRAEVTATPGRTVPSIATNTTVKHQPMHLAPPQPSRDVEPPVLGRTLSVTQTPTWPVSTNSPGTVDRTTAAASGWDAIGWHHAAELRAMAAYSSLMMQNGGALPFGPSNYPASPFGMYGMPLPGTPGSSMPFMPGLSPFNTPPAPETANAAETAPEEAESQPKPRYSYRPAYRCAAVGYFIVFFVMLLAISLGDGCHTASPREIWRFSAPSKRLLLWVCACPGATCAVS